MSSENSVPKFSQQYSLHLPFIRKGKKVDDKMWKDSCYQITKKESQEICDAQELWRIFRLIPSFNESPTDCQYMWFKKDYAPTWEENPDDDTISFKYEEKSDIFENPQKWTGYKCVIEAKVFFLLLAWMGNSIPVLTKQVNGICVKIQKTRIVLSFWVTSPKKTETEEEMSKPIEEGEENVSLERLKRVIAVLLDVGDNTSIEVKVDNNGEKSKQSKRASSKSHGRSSSHDRERGGSRDRRERGDSREGRDRSENRERSGKERDRDRDGKHDKHERSERRDRDKGEKRDRDSDKSKKNSESASRRHHSSENK